MNNNKLDIALAIITWKKPITLKNTLLSYKTNGLLDICSEYLLWCNNRTHEQEQIAQEFNFQVFGPKTRNTGAGHGFVRLAELCTSKYILCLEDDFVLTENYDQVLQELKTGVYLLENNISNTVRYRHRKNPGEPLCSQDLRNQEWICMPLLFEAVFFRDDPTDLIEITKDSSGAYITSYMYSMYTNNPVLYNTDWFYNNIGCKIVPSEQDPDSLRGSFETNMIKIWEDIKPVVAHAPIGLFTHMDLGV